MYSTITWRHTGSHSNVAKSQNCQFVISVLKWQEMICNFHQVQIIVTIPDWSVQVNIKTVPWNRRRTTTSTLHSQGF